MTLFVIAKHNPILFAEIKSSQHGHTGRYLGFLQSMYFFSKLLGLFAARFSEVIYLREAI